METVLYLLLDFGGSAVLSYFLGCFNGAVIVSKYILGDDVRNHGSGNAGLTNFYRTFGGPLTLVVILCDVLKAVIAVGLVGYCADKYFFDGWPFPTYPLADVFSKYWAGLWCLLGHMFPCMFHFKGGKGILSGGALSGRLVAAQRQHGLHAFGLQVGHSGAKRLFRRVAAGEAPQRECRTLPAPWRPPRRWHGCCRCRPPST